MEKPTATPRPKAEATSSNSSKTVANNVSAKSVSTITDFFQNVGVSHINSLPDYCNNKYFYSNIIRHALKPDQVLRGRLTCILTVTPALGNFYGSLHGGSLAAICEMVSIACARTVADVIIDCSVVRGGRNLTVVAMEFQGQENWAVSLYCSCYILQHAPCQDMKLWFNKFEFGYLSLKLYLLMSFVKKPNKILH